MGSANGSDKSARSSNEVRTDICSRNRPHTTPILGGTGHARPSHEKAPIEIAGILLKREFASVSRIVSQFVSGGTPDGEHFDERASGRSVCDTRLCFCGETAKLCPRPEPENATWEGRNAQTVAASHQPRSWGARWSCNATALQTRHGTQTSKRQLSHARGGTCLAVCPAP